MINILTIINDSFAPLAIITGVALLVLGINERYSRVMESLRSLHRDLLKESAENRELVRCYKYFSITFGRFPLSFNPVYSKADI